MHKLILAALTALSFAAAQAAATDCEALSAEKKLSGAAKTSFLRKCEADAKGGAASCTVLAESKRLYGAARTRFVKKCIKDAGT